MTEIVEKDIQKWRTLSSKYIIKRPWLTARCDEVELPNGVRNSEFYVLEYPAWVNIVARTTDGLFVMVRQYRHGLDEVLTELCAGVVERGEKPLEAAKRELQEETGYGEGEWKLISVLSPNATSMNNLSYSFLATDVVKVSAQHLDKTEDIKPLLLTREQLVYMLEHGEMKQALMASPLWQLIANNDI